MHNFLRISLAVFFLAGFTMNLSNLGLNNSSQVSPAFYLKTLVSSRISDIFLNLVNKFTLVIPYIRRTL